MPKFRKRISKQMMFNKLMPTGVSKYSVAPNVRNTPPYDPDFDEDEEATFGEEEFEEVKKPKHKKKKIVVKKVEPETEKVEENDDISEEIEEVEEKPKTKKKTVKAPEPEPEEVEEIEEAEEVEEETSEESDTEDENVEEDESETETEEVAEEDKSQPATEENVPEQTEPEQAEESAETSEKSEKTEEVKETVPPAETVVDDTKQIVVNVYEKILAEKIDEAIAKFKCCDCEICRNKITAAVLNAIPASYVIANREELEQIIADTDITELNKVLMRSVLQTKTQGHK